MLGLLGLLELLLLVVEDYTPLEGTDVVFDLPVEELLNICDDRFRCL